MNIDLKELVVMFNNRKHNNPWNLELIKIAAKKLKHHTHGEKQKKILKTIRKTIHKEQGKARFGDFIDEHLENESYIRHNHHNNTFSFSDNANLQKVLEPTDILNFGDSTGILVRHS